MWVITQRSQFHLIREAIKHQDLLLWGGRRMGGDALAGVKMQHPGTWEGGKHRKWMFKKPSSHTLSKVQPLSIGLSLTGKEFKRKNRKVEKGKNVRKMAWLKIPSFCFDLELLYFHSSLSVSISQGDFGTLDCHSSSWPFPHFRSKMSETMSLQALTSSPLSSPNLSSYQLHTLEWSSLNSYTSQFFPEDISSFISPTPSVPTGSSCGDSEPSFFQNYSFPRSRYTIRMKAVIFWRGGK